jgi:hypothetical protein
MRIPSLVFLMLLTTSLIAQEKPFNPDKKYHPDSLRRWTTSVMGGTSEKHPGFYRYTSKARFDFLIDSTVNTIEDSLTELSYYRKLKPLIAQIGCLHTGISLSNDYQDYLDKTSTLIPIEIFISADKKVRITKDHDMQDIPVGSEVISINSKPIADILSTLIKSIPSDGYNQTEKILILNHRFPFWYQSMIEVTDQFKLEIKINGESRLIELAGATKDKFPTLASLESNYSKPLEFEVVNGTAIMSVHSFAQSTIQENDQHFKKFMEATFKQINGAGIRNLILDLRYNAGGSDGNAAHLASYFFDQSFRYWDKIEVTEALAKEIKGSTALVYRKPIKEGDTYIWQKAKLTNEFDYYLPQKPAKINFKGKTYILTNGLCMSSCSDLVAILSHNKKGLVIGQESGGGYQGNTSGIIPTATIPTGLRITVPLQKYTNAVDPTKNVGHGSLPDYEITPTFENWVKKEDIEMQFTLKLISGHQ